MTGSISGHSYPFIWVSSEGQLVPFWRLSKEAALVSYEKLFIRNKKKQKKKTPGWATGKLVPCNHFSIANLWNIIACDTTCGIWVYQGFWLYQCNDNFAQASFIRVYNMIICPWNEHPLAPRFYIIKLGFTRVYIFSYFCSKHRSWAHVRTASLRRF